MRDGRVSAEHRDCASRARASLAHLAQPLPSDDPRMRRAHRLREYLTQPICVAEPFSGRPGARVPLTTLLADVRAILDGRADHIADADLRYRGALDPNTLTDLSKTERPAKFKS